MQKVYVLFFKDIEFILPPVRGKAAETKSGCPAGQLLNGKLKLVNRGYQTILDESIAHVLVQQKKGKRGWGLL